MFFTITKYNIFHHSILNWYILSQKKKKNGAGVKNSQTLDVKILELLKLLKIINCLGTFVVKNTF